MKTAIITGITGQDGAYLAERAISYMALSAVVRCLILHGSIISIVIYTKKMSHSRCIMAI